MNNDNGVFGEDYQPSHEEEFFHAAEAALIGGYIGHKIDQTRFGIWYNQSRVICWIYRFIALALILWLGWAAALLFYYTICLIVG